MTGPWLADPNIITLLKSKVNGCEPLENFLMLLVVMYAKKLFNAIMDICN